MKAALIRAAMTALTWTLPKGRYILSPGNFPTFYGRLPDEPLLSQLVQAYQEVFREPPWNEAWPEEEVRQNLHQEIVAAKNGFLTLYLKDGKVAGFSYGAVLPADELPAYIALMLTNMPNLPTRRDGQVAYYAELAIRQFARGTTMPLIFLFRPGLEYAKTLGARSCLFWTTPESKIMLVKAVGFEVVAETQHDSKPIIFLYHSNFRPLLTLIQHANWKTVGRFMAKTKTPKAR